MRLCAWLFRTETSQNNLLQLLTASFKHSWTDLEMQKPPVAVGALLGAGTMLALPASNPPSCSQPPGPPVLPETTAARLPAGGR